MNKVVYCPNCGKPLQVPAEIHGDDYFICPFCNSEFANPSKVIRKKPNYSSTNNISFTKNPSYWVIGMAIGVIILIMGSLPNNKKSSNRNSAPVSESIYYTNDGYFFATSKDVFDRMMECMMHNDVDAMNRLTVAGVVMTLPANTEVFLLKAGIGTVVIRLKGETLQLWTTSEAIHQ